MGGIVQNVYFIYSLEKDKCWEIISDHPISIISSFCKNNDRNISFNINLYRINIDKTELKNNATIKIQLINKNDKKYFYDYSISIYNFLKNLYLYDVEFEKSNELEPPLQYNLTLDEKYEIFSEQRKIDGNLIILTEEKLAKEIHYNFSFFISILNDIILSKFSEKEIVEHINIFDLNKVIFDEKKIYYHWDIKRLFSLLEELTKKNFDYNNNKINQNSKLIHDLLLIWIYKYDQHLIESSFYKKLINKNILKILLNKDNHDKFILLKGLKLSKYAINGFIKIINDYKDLLIILSYNDNFLESLEIIEENFDLIVKKSKNKGIVYIKFDNFIKPNKKDDLNKIKTQLEKILILETKYNVDLFKISEQHMKIYYFFHKNNFNELVNLFDTLKKILIYNRGWDDRSLLNSLILDIDQELNFYAIEGELTNKNLIYCIKRQNLYLDKRVLNSIDLDTIDDEFIKEFKEINWEKILYISKEDLIIQIFGLIKNLENFEKIFLLFDFNKEINSLQMNNLKNKFFDLVEIYNEKEYNNIIDVSSKLIYFLNVKNCDLKSFFEEFFIKFYNITEQVFCDIFSNYEYNNIKNDLKDIIHDFYNNPENNDLNKSLYLIYEIENNENFDPDELESYFIDYDNFFDLNKSDIFSFLEKIKSKKLLEYKCLEEYIENAIDKTQEIISKIKDGTVEYIKIKNFFENNNGKNELKKRIDIISKFLDKYEENKNMINDIEQKINNINKIKEGLNAIEQKMNIFFKKSRKEEIKEIQDILMEIESNGLDYYLIKQVPIKKFLEMKDFEKLPLNFEKYNFFFKILYNEAKTKIEDEIEIINETNKNLRNFILLLNSNTFTKENINYINKIMNELNEEQYKNLGGEIENLKNLNIYESEEEKEKILNNLKYIWKKDVIYNFSILFKLILQKKNFKKTEFTSVNNLISKYLKDPKNINIIKVCLEFYKNYGIELNEEKYFDFFKSFKSINNMNDIVHFLINADLQSIKTKIKEFEEDGYKDYNYRGDFLVKLMNFINSIENILKNIDIDAKDLNIIRNYVKELLDSNENKDDFISIFNNFELIKKLINNKKIIKNN